MQCFNPAYQTSAKLVFAKFPEVEFTTQSFTFPGVSVNYPKIAHVNLRLPMQPGGVNYEPLTLNFLLDSNLKNYMSIVKWMQSSPTAAASDIFSQATVFLLDSNKQVVDEVYFEEVMPISISSINYQFTVADPQVLTATATFDYTQFRIGS